MTPQDLILAELRGIKEDISEIKTDIAEVKVEVKATNGRVRALELWRATVQAVKASQDWVKPLVVGAATGALAVIVAELIRIT